MAENNSAQSPSILERYIEGMPSFPNWREREKLQESAHKNNGDIDRRRLKLWDYFFRINREELTRPYREKTRQLRQCLQELRSIQEELRLKKRGIEREVRQWAKLLPQRNRRMGLVLVTIGLVILASSFVLFFIPQKILLALSAISVLFIVGLLVTLGGVLLLNSSELTDDEIRKEVEKRLSTERLRLTKRVIKTLQTVAFTTAKNWPDKQNQVDVEEIDKLVYRERILAWLILVGGTILGLTAVFAGMSFIWVTFIICSLWFATRNKTSSQYVEKETEKRLAIAIGNVQIENLDNQGEKIRFDLSYYIQAIDQYIKLLDREIKSLLDQIPDIPSDSQVKEWFDEMIKETRNEAILESGMEDQVLPERGFPTYVPAKYQKNIPPGFRENQDNLKHLKATQTAKVGGVPHEFSGVYYMEFILVGNDMLAVYSTFFDFIMQTSFSPKWRVFHFIDIVSIQSDQNYISFNDPDEIGSGVDDMPLLTLTLTSGEQIRINYPNDSYIKRKSNEFDPDKQEYKWVYNMEEVVKNANRHIRQQMRNFKNQALLQIDESQTTV